MPSLGEEYKYCATRSMICVQGTPKGDIRETHKNITGIRHESYQDKQSLHRLAHQELLAAAALIVLILHTCIMVSLGSPIIRQK